MFDDILSIFQRTLCSFKQLHHLITSNVLIASVKAKLKNISTERLLTSLSQIQLNLVILYSPLSRVQFIFRWIRFVSHLLLTVYSPRQLNYFLYSCRVGNIATSFPGMFPQRLGGKSFGTRLEIAGLNILQRDIAVKIEGMQTSIAQSVCHPSLQSSMKCSLPDLLWALSTSGIWELDQYFVLPNKVNEHKRAFRKMTHQLLSNLQGLSKCYRYF